jgi:O-antigen/teichoic acid export membrane protein
MEDARSPQKPSRTLPELKAAIRQSRSALVGLTSKFGTTVIGFAAMPYLVSQLGTTGWAIVSFVTVSQTVLSWCELGIPTLASKELAQSSPERRMDLLLAFERTMLIGCALSALLSFLLVTKVADLGNYEQRVSGLVDRLLISGSTSIAIISVLYSSASTALGRYEYVTTVNFAAALARALFGCAAVATWQSTTAYLSVNALLNACQCLAIRLDATKSLTRTKEISSLSLIKNNYQFLIYTTVTSLLLGLGIHGDKFLISRMLPLSHVGLYFISATIGTIGYSVISTVVGSKAQKMYQKSEQSLEAQLGFPLRPFIWISGGLFTCSLIAFGERFAEIWMGRAVSELKDVVAASIIISYAWTFYAQFQVQSIMSARRGLASKQAISALAGACVYGVVLPILTECLGIIGSAMAFLIYCVSLFLTLLYRASSQEHELAPPPPRITTFIWPTVVGAIILPVLIFDNVETVAFTTTIVAVVWSIISAVYLVKHIAQKTL